MSWNLVSDKIRTHICRTPEEVLNIVAELDRCGSAEFEREFYEDKKHVRELKAALLSGLMLTFQWCLALVTATGIWRRVNGQHSSRIFRELSEEEWQQIQFPVVIYWEEYACDTELDMAELFEQFDQTWRGRSPEDYVGFHLAMHPDLREPIGRHLALHLTGGMRWYFEKLRQQSYTALESHQFLHVPSHHPFLAYCGGTLSKNKTHEMLHKAVIAAIFHTLRHDTEEIRAFWKQVALGMNSNPEGSPELKLAEFLEHVDDKELGMAQADTAPMAWPPKETL